MNGAISYVEFSTAMGSGRRGGGKLARRAVRVGAGAVCTATAGTATAGTATAGTAGTG